MSKREKIVTWTCFGILMAMTITFFATAHRWCDCDELVDEMSPVVCLVQPADISLIDPELLAPEGAMQEGCSQVVERYAGITISETERDELAKLIYFEAGSQSVEGQQAVAEVVLNRVVSSQFPASVHDVIFQKGQFPPSQFLDRANPTLEQYDAIDNALYQTSILPLDVVFFSENAENSRIWGQIDGHVFCREYIWQ